MLFDVLKDIKQKHLHQGSFALNVMTLLSGTTIAQAIPILVSPILTRLYTPADFGVLALYLSLCSFFITVATGCYEYAVVLPQRDEDAINISFLSFLIAFFVSVFVLIIIGLSGDYISAVFKNPGISQWLYFIPLSILISAVYNTLNFWGNRKKIYGTLSVTKITQAASTSATQLSFGTIKMGGSGLVIGNIVGQILSGGYLVWKILNAKNFRLTALSRKRLIDNAKRYQNFPKFNSLQYLSNGFRANGIVFLISSYFGASVLGLYAFAMKVIQIPLNLISSSLLQVFYQRLSEAYNKKEPIWPLQKRLILKMLYIVLPAIIFIMALAPIIFSFIFGEKWREAGTFAVYLMPWLSVNFIFAPLSVIPMVLNYQKRFMYIMFGYNMLLPATVFIALYLDFTIKVMLICLSTSGFTYQIFILFWFRSISLRYTKSLNYGNTR